MFARVITATAGVDGIAGVLDLAERQLPGAQERPGFQGYQVLVGDESGQVLIISYWETREQMEAVAGGTTEGIQADGLAATGLVAPRLETFEVALNA